MRKSKKGNEAQEEQTRGGQVSLKIKESENELSTVFVSRDYRIKDFDSTIDELMKMNPFKVDLEFEDYARQFRNNGLKSDIDYVIENQVAVNREIRAVGDSNYYMMEIRPYQTEERVKGVLINYVDITELKEAKEALAQKVKKIKNLQRQLIKQNVNERWRVGELLHDHIGQSLVSVEIMLNNVKTSIDDEETELKESIDTVIDVVRNSMKDARDLSHEIVPVDIEEGGISHAFNNLAEQLENKYGINIELDYDDTVNEMEDIDLATHLYQIVQESAKNAVVHGNAEKGKITLKSDDQFMYLHIADDGIGISDTKEEDGMGINIMRHRMELLGGELEVKDTSELGTHGITISCKMPLENKST